MINTICGTCEHSVTCDTWGEIKCLKRKQRIYDIATVANCPHYKKRGKNFKESKCQCEDCLKNVGDEE